MKEGNEKVPIPKYFQGKSLLITGGSGFLGKVLIEKLLRSCPDISIIYILLRPKKGKTLQERVEAITSIPLFDLLKSTYPENVQKIVPIYGDVTELGLGLSNESRKILIESVNIIYHAAASVRFDDSLKDAIILNTRGTREVALLAREMKHLELLVHISTTYCHTDKQIIEEKIYPTEIDWKQSINIAESLDSHTLNIFASHYMNSFPNSYTFTKRLSEDLLTELCSGRIPTVIIRPSIVISTADEPMPGWIDNFNGPVGLLCACGKGILRSLYTDPDLIADYIPVDMAVKGIIGVTWLDALEKNQDNSKQLQISVFNASNNNVNSITYRELMAIGDKVTKYYPFHNTLWLPQMTITKFYILHYIRIIFFHVIPALFIDGLLKMAGKKFRLLKIQRKIFIANMALHYFITQTWTFKNDKALRALKMLLPSDYKDFYLDPKDHEPYLYFINATMGVKKYLFKEDPKDLDIGKKHYFRMLIINIIFNILWYLGLFYVFVFKLNILDCFKDILHYIYTYFCNL